MKIKRDNIFFVLVEPQHPGNIGAAARALKTMGFKKLVLVNPGNYKV
ncbi:MAG: TrmH family RNA methyltransferase, partial [Calditrichia bacterium]